MRLQVYILGALVVAGLSFSACSKSRKATAKKSPTTQRSDVRSAYASRLGVSAGQLKNERLYIFIDEWEGTPYRYGGTTKSGADCSGFVGALYQDVYKKQLPRTTSQLDQGTKTIAKNNLQEGDIVFFDIEGKKNAHVGVYLVNNKFVHASSSKGVTISDLENPYYKKAFAKGGRH